VALAKGMSIRLNPLDSGPVLDDNAGN